jgi:hypothetical protein
VSTRRVGGRAARVSLCSPLPASASATLCAKRSSVSGLPIRPGHAPIMPKQHFLYVDDVPADLAASNLARVEVPRRRAFAAGARYLATRKFCSDKQDYLRPSWPNR